PALSTSKILLVPYTSSHVPQYHTWMLDPELQSATASEPLSLAEEYAMQKSWRADGDKLTFIVCLPEASSSAAREAVVEGDGEVVVEGDVAMIGDINLFLYPFETDDDDDDGNDDRDIPAAKQQQQQGGEEEEEEEDLIVGEIELMIARKDLHRRGYGRAALLAFVDYTFAFWQGIGEAYARSTHSSDHGDQEGGTARSPRAPLQKKGKLRYLRVKINQMNEGSIRLFESVGFVRVGEEANYFGEVELRWTVDDDD
ncbi:uncharacterized protein K489DRAFT_288854, partial [Dissoconium aciculare CBS 342.82]|uniref:N-acetyltransferase domain-containing protein n=1 Tax=Dissoconium aciculare CBS 342.82 TaxID=1314786 RepID=A0A6J3M8F4_9PEZI